MARAGVAVGVMLLACCGVPRWLGAAETNVQRIFEGRRLPSLHERPGPMPRPTLLFVWDSWPTNVLLCHQQWRFTEVSGGVTYGQCDYRDYQEVPDIPFLPRESARFRGKSGLLEIQTQTRSFAESGLFGRYVPPHLNGHCQRIELRNGQVTGGIETWLGSNEYYTVGQNIDGVLQGERTSLAGEERWVEYFRDGTNEGPRTSWYWSQQYSNPVTEVRTYHRGQYHGAFVTLDKEGLPLSFGLYINGDRREWAVRPLQPTEQTDGAGAGGTSSHVTDANASDHRQQGQTKKVESE